MISLPSDFTAAPVLPSSGIAPKGLIGNANFPQLLGGFQTGTANAQEVSARVKTGLDASKGAGPASLVNGQLPALQPSGNLLPRSGTELPLDQKLALEGGEGSGIRTGEVLEASDQAQFDLNAPYAAPVETRAIEDKGSSETAFVVQPATQPRAIQPRSEESIIGRDGPALGPVEVTRPNDAAAAPATSELARVRDGVAAPQGEPRGVREQGTDLGTVSTRMAPQEGAPVTGSAVRAERPDPLLPQAVTPQTEGLRTTPEQSPAQNPAQPPPQTTTQTPTQTLSPKRAATVAGGERSPEPEPDATRGGGDATSSANSKEQVQAAASPVAQAQIANKPMEDTDRPARVFLAAGQLVQSQALPSRSMPGNDVRAAADGSGSRIALVPGESTQGSKGNPLPPAVLNMEGEVDPDMPRVPLPAAAIVGGVAATSAQAAPLGFGETAAPQPSASQPPASQPQAAAVPTAPQPNAPAPVTDTGAVLRATPQLESAIEQLAETRSAAQANKPELTVRHQEFGAITMRLETTAGDLRATLSARDPGFVPAIQAALAERSIAASSDASTNNSNKGGDQTGSGSDPRGNQQSGSFAGSHGQNHGQGWGFGAGYGSSTGSGQGTSQPYPGQTGDRDEESGSDLGNRGMGLGTGRGDGPEGEGEIFA